MREQLRELARVARMTVGLLLVAIGIYLLVRWDTSSVAKWVALVFAPWDIALGLMLYLYQTHAPLLARPHRWIRWNIHCLRGRTCAHVVVDSVRINALTDDAVLPDNSDVVLGCDYICEGCGTEYRTTWILDEDGEPIQSPRVRM